MAFMDLFKPKWKHSDKNVRKNAIENLTDRATLLEIAKNEKDEDVRNIAMTKLAELIMPASKFAQIITDNINEMLNKNSKND